MIPTLNKYKVQLLYIPLAVYWTSIFVFTSLPASKSISTGISDKVEHFIAFFGLGALLDLSLSVQVKFPRAAQFHGVFSIVLCWLYGSLDEIHQLWVPGRSCELNDWIADAIGTVIGITFIFLLKQADSRFLAGKTQDAR